jgi:hypothetical protein
MLSPNSIQSEWVKRELNAALMRELEDKKVVVLPILIADCKIPVLLKEKKYADFRESYEKGFEDFLLAVSPENSPTIRHSTDFRTAQYLLSGLTSTDSNGTNTLNLAQLRRIYPYRRELHTFLDNDQRRLLFWSAAAFKYANSHKPFFLDITTPVWGLITNTNSEQLANWIIDGLGGVLFDHLVQYYSWAKNVSGTPKTLQLKKAFIIRQSLQSDFLSALGPIAPYQMLAFLRASAEDDRDFFQQYFLPQLDKNLPPVPMILEATASFSHPLDDDFYFRFIDSDDKKAFAAFNALAELRRPMAITFLRAYIEKGKKIDTPLLDLAFMKLGHPEFVPELRLWLDSNLSLDLQVRILTALSNANASDRDRILQAINELFQDECRFELIPTIVRAYGHCGVDLEGHLDEWINKWNNPVKPIQCEAAIFALGRVAGHDSESILSKLLTSKSDTILAAAIETMAKHLGQNTYERLRGFSTHQSILVQSSFYRALLHIRPSDWQSYMPLLMKQHPLVRLCGARVFAQLASPETLGDWLDDLKADEMLKIAADEMLFAPRPLAPQWIVKPQRFNPELARLPVRLTNLDSDEVWINTNFDIDRMTHIHAMQGMT